MCNKINKKVYKKRVAAHNKITARQGRFVNYNSAKSVILLFESDFSEKNPGIRKIIYKLQQDGKKVSAWGFVDKKMITSSRIPDFKILNNKDTNLFRVPRSNFISEIENQNVDLLIDLTLKPIIPIHYLALHANASCKAGMKKATVDFYDFVIDLQNYKKFSEKQDACEYEQDQNYLFEQIIFYLKSIQTND